MLLLCIIHKSKLIGINININNVNINNFIRNEKKGEEFNIIMKERNSIS